MEIEDIIIKLKKDNKKCVKQMKAEGKINWEIDKVEGLVNLYLDSVLRLSIEQTQTKEVGK